MPRFSLLLRSENLLNLLIKFILLAQLTSCASVPDVPICVELNISKAWCTHTISGKDFYIDDSENKFNGKTWWDIRPTMVQVPSDSWAEIKSFIIKKCKKGNDCNKHISSWDRTVNNVDSNLAKKSKNPNIE